MDNSTRSNPEYQRSRTSSPPLSRWASSRAGSFDGSTNISILLGRFRFSRALRHRQPASIPARGNRVLAGVVERRGELATRSDPELSVRVAEMNFDCLWSHVEGLSDVPVRQPVGGEIGDSSLAGRQCKHSLECR